MNNLERFQVGSALDSDNQSYVVRQADELLLNALQKGHYCYVLNSRQMGKSSLMVRTADKLRKNNVVCAFSDVSSLGVADVTPEQWYKSFADHVLESLDLDDIDLDKWWKKNDSFTAINCLGKFFKEIILNQFKSQIVVFIDEIDSIINLPFKDDFFALIRSFCNKRTTNSEYKRLTFCLLGVATPSDLIEDKTRTPFNIGESITLSGFTVDECKDALLPGFPDCIEQPEAVLKDIIYWTGGQPFLTQKLCKIIAESAKGNNLNVKEIVDKCIIDDWESQDEPRHFRTIRDRLLYNPNNTFKILEIYREIIEQGKIVADNSTIENQLKISGIVIKKGNYLQAFNPIYQEVFNLNWIKEQLDNLRPYGYKLTQWLNSRKSYKYLLDQKELEDALKWEEGKHLTRDDYDYLSASRDKKSQKIISRSKKNVLGLLGVSGLILTTVIVWGHIKNRSAQKFLLNKKSDTALQSFNKGNQLSALINIIETNNELKKKIRINKNITNYLTVEPISAINRILQQIQEKNTIAISNSSVTYLTYSDNGQTLIAGNEAGIVNLWNTKNQKNGNSWNDLKDKGKVTGIVVSPNRQKAYISIEADNEGINVFNQEGNRENIFNTSSQVSSLAIDYENNIIISGDVSGNVILWTKDGTNLNRWQAHDQRINSIAISPDGQTIATASNDNTVKLWTKEGKLKTMPAGTEIEHSNSVNKVIFSPDGQTIATASNDTTVKLWNKDGSSKTIFPKHSYSVNSVAFSPDSKIVATASDDNTIGLWENKKRWENSKKLPKAIIGDQNAVTQNVKVTQIVFNPNGKTFATADSEGKVKIWQTPNLTNRISTATFTKDNEEVIFAEVSKIKLKSLNSEKSEILPNFGALINTIAINFDDSVLVAGTQDGLIAQLNLQQSKTWKILEKDRYKGEVVAVDINPTGDKFVTLGVDNLSKDKVDDLSSYEVGKSSKNKSYVLKQWNIKGNSIKTLYNTEEKITAIKYNPEGNKIAIAYQDGNIELWNDADDSRELIVNREQTLDFQENITAISFSEDGKLIATGNQDGEIQLRTIDGKLITTFTKNDNRKIVALEFTTDSKTLKAIDQYGIVSDWDLDIDTLIRKGCNWLQDYLAAQGSTTEISQICSPFSQDNSLTR